MKRTLCPICLHSIRIRKGRLVDHGWRGPLFMRPCPGSGMEVGD